MAKKFIAGETYLCRSICDYDCIWHIKIIKRTAKTVTIMSLNDNKRCKIYRFKNGDEYIKPKGIYSMAPTLSAENLIQNKGK